MRVVDKIRLICPFCPLHTVNTDFFLSHRFMEVRMVSVSSSSIAIAFILQVHKEAVSNIGNKVSKHIGNKKSCLGIYLSLKTNCWTQLFRTAVTGTGKLHNFNKPLYIIFEDVSAEIKPVHLHQEREFQALFS